MRKVEVVAWASMERIEEVREGLVSEDVERKADIEICSRSTCLFSLQRRMRRGRWNSEGTIGTTKSRFHDWSEPKRQWRPRLCAARSPVESPTGRMERITLDHLGLTWVTKQTVWKVARPEAMPEVSLLLARRELELSERERKARIGEMIERLEQTISLPMLPSLSNIKQLDPPPRAAPAGSAAVIRTKSWLDDSYRMFCPIWLSR